MNIEYRFLYSKDIPASSARAEGGYFSVEVRQIPPEPSIVGSSKEDNWLITPVPTEHTKRLQLPHCL